MLKIFSVFFPQRAIEKLLLKDPSALGVMLSDKLLVCCNRFMLVIHACVLHF